MSNRIGDPNSSYRESMGITCQKIIFGLSANAEMPRLGSKAAKAKLKEIGGSLYERWSVWFNSTIRAESYQCRKYTNKAMPGDCFSNGVFNGTAWLSSVRIVKCNIKLFNERNPYHKFQDVLEVKDTRSSFFER